MAQEEERVRSQVQAVEDLLTEMRETMESVLQSRDVVRCAVDISVLLCVDVLC
jgi:hypothetical protein